MRFAPDLDDSVFEPDMVSFGAPAPN